MHFERHLSVLLLDVSDGGIGRHLEDHEGIEGLKLFHWVDHFSVEVPQVPEEGAHHQSEIECSLEDLTTSFLLFQSDERGASGARTLRFEVFDLDIAPDHRLGYTPCEGQEDGCEDRDREVIECGVIILQHVFLRVSLEVIREWGHRALAFSLFLIIKKFIIIKLKTKTPD